MKVSSINKDSVLHIVEIKGNVYFVGRDPDSGNWHISMAGGISMLNYIAYHTINEALAAIYETNNRQK